MLGRALWMTWLVGCAACSFDPKGSDPFAVDAGANGPDAPAFDAGPAPDVPGMCVEHCDGPTLVECNANVEQRSDCRVDCSEAGGPHCADLVGSNDLDPDWLVGADGELRAMDGDVITIEADTGQIWRGGTVIRAAGEGLVSGIRYIQGPPYNVFVFDRLRVDRNGTVLVRAIGTGGVTSPIIIYLSDRATINGLIDITAGCPDSTRWCAGVGGGNGGTSSFVPLGCAKGGEGMSGAILEDSTGGGGGGFGQNGAPGGASADFPGGTGGINTTCPGETLVPLEGGSGGDRGGSGGRGGGGGGGLQITALREIKVAPMGGGVPAGVWAGGGGGEGGGLFDGGGGGGSGGAIFLEAPVVDVGSGAILAANGGGGGEGDGSGNGLDGLLADMPAGGGGGTVARHGGPGGCCTTPPEAGDGPGSGTGGGGGGAGRIRINGRDVTVNGTVTPPPSIGPIVVQ